MSYSERKGRRMNTQFDEELNRFINVLEKQITSVEIEYDNLLIDYHGEHQKKKLLDMMINEITSDLLPIVLPPKTKL